MHAIFIDESGYTPDWLNGLEQQPFYVVSAVLLPCDTLAQSYSQLRTAVTALGLPQHPAPLGQGFEIKAKEIASGSGWWKTHHHERNEVRDLMLSFPKTHGGVAVLVIVDKAAHRSRYRNPENPYLLSLKYLLERVSQFLWEANEYGICIYDNNKRIEADVAATAAHLMRAGSDLSYFSNYLGGFFSGSISIERVLEFTLGTSENSIGLQVADYFATFGYQYFKRGKPNPCGWWDTLNASLRRRENVVEGFGLKLCP